MSEATILVSGEAPVRILTLNRPASLNAFTAQMHGLLLRRCHKSNHSLLVAARMMRRRI